MKKHVVVTRMLYEHKKDFLERLELYKETALKSLQNQKNKDFDIAVLCNSDHDKYLKSLGIIPFHRKDGLFGEKTAKGWHSFVDLSGIEGLDKYYIQSNLDSDDEVLPEYIDKVQELLLGNKKIHLHFQPMLRDYKTKEEKEMATKYSNDCCSAFFSLYQPVEEGYIYLGCDSHKNMSKYADKTILLNGFCFVNIHDDNDTSSMWS